MASISPSPPFSTRKAVSRSFYMVDHNTGRSLPTRSFLTLIQVSFQLLIFGFSLQKSFDLHRDSSCSAGIACICSKILKLKTERISLYVSVICISPSTLSHLNSLFCLLLFLPYGELVLFPQFQLQHLLHLLLLQLVKLSLADTQVFPGKPLTGVHPCLDYTLTDYL